jgi:hypothetical protein
MLYWQNDGHLREDYQGKKASEQKLSFVIFLQGSERSFNHEAFHVTRLLQHTFKLIVHGFRFIELCFQNIENILFLLVLGTSGCTSKQ